MVETTKQQALKQEFSCWIHSLKKASEAHDLPHPFFNVPNRPCVSVQDDNPDDACYQKNKKCLGGQCGSNGEGMDDQRQRERGRISDVDTIFDLLTRQ